MGMATVKEWHNSIVTQKTLKQCCSSASRIFASDDLVFEHLFDTHPKVSFKKHSFVAPYKLITGPNRLVVFDDANFGPINFWPVWVGGLGGTTWMVFGYLDQS